MRAAAIGRASCRESVEISGLEFSRVLFRSGREPGPPHPAARRDRDDPADPRAVVDVLGAAARVRERVAGTDRLPDLAVARLVVLVAAADRDELLDARGRDRKSVV